MDLDPDWIVTYSRARARARAICVDMWVWLDCGACTHILAGRHALCVCSDARTK